MTVEIHDLLGRVVRRLVDGVREAGEWSVAWDGTDDRGGKVSTGVYICRIRTGDFTRTIRMVLVK